MREGMSRDYMVLRYSLNIKGFKTKQLRSGNLWRW
jgi:hypothetical protein